MNKINLQIVDENAIIELRLGRNAAKFVSEANEVTCISDIASEVRRLVERKWRRFRCSLVLAGN